MEHPGMRVTVFDAHRFDRESLERANGGGEHELCFCEQRLGLETVGAAAGSAAVCVFVNDRVDAPVLEALAGMGVRVVALRCAGFNNVDLAAARRLGVGVVRVPEYSPHAVAEHAVALLLALNRKLTRANHRIREGNFSLDGLVGFDLFGKTVGVVGTGKIGATFARIMRGFGCRLLGMDMEPDASLSAETGMEYRSLEGVLSESDVVSLHVPLNAATRHLMNRERIGQMRRGAFLINTGRGALVDTPALVEALKSGQVGAAGLDVYEEEEGVFFEDHSGDVLRDEQLAWLILCPNVLVTSHQAFLTREALSNIADTTLSSLTVAEARWTGRGPVGAAGLGEEGVDRAVLVAVPVGA
jgi:D-lactate dehydrogenase